MPPAAGEPRRRGGGVDRVWLVKSVVEHLRVAILLALDLEAVQVCVLSAHLGGAAAIRFYACGNLRRQEVHSPSNQCTSAVIAIDSGSDMIALKASGFGGHGPVTVHRFLVLSSLGCEGNNELHIPKNPALPSADLVLSQVCVASHPEGN
ncbi:hypothetical protein NG895_07120 [Aeoliella sp. ICT_H6.2]|uniref:Uncharacterized protein n=1 Tax=Aeoliella straminimaris TaxID=2954799 RepID=A0A9X2F8A4_9BACT|nr:hypothetical protein [Aeoliella straminimaris]MCO6043674.1 hypothetical protein [Aeoliella straminimaris]